MVPNEQVTVTGGLSDDQVEVNGEGWVFYEAKAHDESHGVNSLIVFILSSGRHALRDSRLLRNCNECLTHVDTILYFEDQVGEVTANALIIDGSSSRDKRLVEVLRDGLTSFHCHLRKCEGCDIRGQARVSHYNVEGNGLGVSGH